MLNTTEKKKKLSTETNTEESNFLEIMRQSYDFWHKNYLESSLNYALIWKKGLETNSEIVAKIEQMLKDNAKQAIEIQIQQFFEMWSYAVRKSDFELAKKSMSEWEEFWENTTTEKRKIYGEILQIIGRYWKEMQMKNLE